ncbi:MAG: BolA protein [Cellvibrionaceae bacterium]|jgi:BolA protein
MDIQHVIEQKLKIALEPTYLKVVNESYKHQVPEGSQTHFQVIIVSAIFLGKTRIERHRKVYQLLLAELENSIKALSVSASDPQEWLDKNRELPSSPPCLGGSTPHNRTSEPVSE